MKYYGWVLGLVAMFLVGFCFAGNAKAQIVGVTTPTAPTGLSGSATPPSTISLTWTASTESSGTIAGYYVYRNGAQIATTNITSFSDIGLAGGAYVYTVSAFDTSGVASALSSPTTISFVSDTTPPSAPSNVTVSGATSTNSENTQIPVTVSWTASTDNVGVAGYKIYRNSTLLTTSTAPYTSTSYTDSVTPGMYSYTVVAYDTSGNISKSSPSVSIFINVDTNPPSLPANLVTVQSSATSLDLSWASSTDPAGIAGYQVFRDGTQIATTTGASYGDTGLTPDTAYTYAVAAFDNAGNFSAISPSISAMVQVVTGGPTTPSGLSAVLVGTSTVRFSWASVLDTLAVTGYSVYRNGTQIATVSSTSYTDTGLASGTYAYAVSAADISGATSPISSSTSIVVSWPNAANAAAVTASTGVATGVTVTAPALSPQASAVSVPVLSGISPGANPIFSQFLYFGLSGSQVSSLQSFLIANGYLSPSVRVTGVFGSLTLAALKKFQCARGVACNGAAGWGTVGPKTRAALNANAASVSSPTTSPSVSTPATASSVTPSSQPTLAAQLQALEAELTALESQAQK